MVREICLIRNFILPSLNAGTFGHLLQWVDEDKMIFKVFWSHKSRRTWTRAFFAVFLEWDRMKGRTNYDEAEFFTKSKGRFRSALNRLSKCGKVEKLKSSIIGYRMYQLSEVPEMQSPQRVPDIYVEVPVHREDMENHFYMNEMQWEVPNSPDVCQMKELNPQNDLENIEDLTDYYEDLPDELLYSLDGINGDIVIANNIQEPLIIPENFSISGNEDEISEEFLRLFQDDVFTFMHE